MIAAVKIEKLQDMLTITQVDYVSFNDLFVEAGAMHTSVFGIFLILIYLLKRWDENNNLLKSAGGANLHDVRNASNAANVYALQTELAKMTS